ncbi:MAG: transcription termination/antitermination protein NusG [Desulfobacteraceae bacterium]
MFKELTVDYRRMASHLNRGEESNQGFEAAWYVIHTRCHHEGKVEVGLNQKGMEIFLPRMAVPSRRRDRRRILEVPLFPGYLFVHTELQGQAYYDIVKLPGVVRLLGVNGCLMPVPAETIQSIQSMVGSGRLYYPCNSLKVGMRVRIAEGPLAGAVGCIARRQGKKRRLVVTVEMLGRAVAVELEDEAVEPYN